MRLPPKRTPQIYLVQRKYCTDQREIYAYHGLFSFVRARGGMYPAYPIFQKFLTKIDKIITGIIVIVIIRKGWIIDLGNWNGCTTGEDI